jgi:tRNA(adenine34) deaminase
VVNNPVSDESRLAVDERWMRIAIAEAELAVASGEVPVGAVIVRGDAQIAIASNDTVRSSDPSAHAEMRVIREASQQLGDWRLTGCTIYVTLEPCAMCAGAIVLARMHRVVFGAWDEKAGMAGSVGDLLRHPALNHQPQVAGGVLRDECAELLQEFFRSRR